MYLTPCALNNPSSSLKSGCASIVLLSKEIDGFDSFLRGLGKPMLKIRLGGARIVQRVLGYHLLDHAPRLAFRVRWVKAIYDTPRAMRAWYAARAAR